MEIIRGEDHRRTRLFQGENQRSSENFYWVILEWMFMKGEGDRD
jgi:hypothetical protein